MGERLDLTGTLAHQKKRDEDWICSLTADLSSYGVSPIGRAQVGLKRRFGELKKCLPNITERMLTLQLRKLKENNIVKRTVYAEVPLRVEYELTPIGYELRAIIHELGKWGKKHKAIKAM